MAIHYQTGHNQTGRTVLKSLTCLLLTMLLGHAKFLLGPQANAYFPRSKCLLPMLAEVTGCSGLVRLQSPRPGARSQDAP